MVPHHWHAGNDSLNAGGRCICKQQECEVFDSQRHSLQYSSTLFMRNYVESNLNSRTQLSRNIIADLSSFLDWKKFNVYGVAFGV